MGIFLNILNIDALENNINRLQEDHDNAQLFAQSVHEEVPQIQIENYPPATNIVFFKWQGTQLIPAQFLAHCIRKGLRFSQVDTNRFRAVTHLDIKREDVRRALVILQEVCRE